MPRPMLNTGRPAGGYGSQQSQGSRGQNGPLRFQTGTQNEPQGSLLHARPLDQRTQTQSRKESGLSRMEQDRLLRRRRSRDYMEAMHRLDTGGHVHNEAQTEEIIHMILDEFPELQIEGVMLGIVAVCYLGDPYEVHCLDMGGGILHHYKRGEPLPGGLEKARGIALCGSYDFIEVYTDCCRAVSSTGAVSVIR